MPETGPSPGVRWLPWLALTALLGLSAVLLVSSAQGELVGDLADGLPASLWLDHWTLEQLAQGALPGRSEAVHWPLGAESRVVAGAPLPALLAAPFIALFGYPGFWNPFLVFCLVCNGLAAGWLARQTGASALGSLLAGLAFGLAPALLREAGTGNQEVFFAAPLPLALGLGLQGLGGTRRQALIGGGALVLACLSWWPYGLLTGGVLVSMAVWKARLPEERGQVLDRLGWMGRATLPGLVLLLPLLASRLRAADHASPLSRLPEAITDINAARIDFAMGTASSLPPGRLVALSEQPGEVLGSILVLALLAAWFLVQGRRQLIWPALLVAASVASVGAWLDPAYGASDGWLPMPLAWAQAWMPGLDGIARPSRFLVLAAMAASVMLGLLWTRLEADWSLRSRSLGSVALASVLLVMPWASGVAPLQGSDWAPPEWVEAIDAPGAVVHLPLGWSEAGALWQPLHGQPIAGGPGEVQAFASNSPSRRLFEERPELRPLWLVEEARLGEPEIEQLQRAGLGWIVVDEALVDLIVESNRDLEAWALPVLVARVDEAFGPAVYDDGELRVYRVLAEAP